MLRQNQIMLALAIIATLGAIVAVSTSSPLVQASSNGHGNTHQHNVINAGNGGGSNQGNGQTCINGVCH